MSTTASTPRLSEVARKLVVPDGITTSVYHRIRPRLTAMAVEFDGWQEGAATVALGCRADGKFAATVGGVVWSIPRQVGKTFTVGNLLIALAIELAGIRIVWTSHHGRTTTNSFRAMQGMVRRKQVRPFMPPGGGVRTANGEQEIRFANGSIIMFGAREHGFGRGMDAVDILVFDEAQILDIKALEDMVPATNQARNPHGGLIFFIGTPPRPIDNGEAFTTKRQRALDGDVSDMFYVEMAADPDADIDDREQWARANPSYPVRTPLESMLRMRENIPDDDSWRREALGIWDVVANKGVIPPPSWQEREDEHSAAVARLSLGVEVGPDLAWASVALAGERADGDWHFELDDDQHTRGKGTGWLVPHLQYLTANNPSIGSIVVDLHGPVSALLEERNGRWFFKGADGKITDLQATPVKVAELGSGCANVLAGITTGWLHHIGQPQFTAAALAAGKRALGDTGMWVWSRKTAESDITPIQAATLALIGARAQPHNVRKPARTGRGRRVVTY